MKLALILIIAGLASGEDLYIAQSSAGSADGSSCANAFAVTFFNTAGNWGAGAGKISPGDTVHGCGTITSKLLFQASGTTGNPITFLFESGAKMSAATWGTGATGEAISFQGNAAASFLTINGGTNGLIEATDNGSSPTFGHQDDDGAIFFTSCSNCIVHDLIVSNIYVKNTTDSQGGGDAIHIQQGDNVEIYNVTVHDSELCVTVDFTGAHSNVKIHNNTISRCNWGIKSSDGAASATLSGLQIYSNDISDAVNWDDLSSNSFHHNYVILFTTNNSVQIVSPQIYSNYFHGNPGVHMTANIFLDVENGTMSTAQIFNNVFFTSATGGNSPANGMAAPGCNTGGGCMAGEASVVYNNLFYYEANVGGRCLQTGTSTNVTDKNNIYLNCGAVFSISGTLTSDYNDFFGFTTFDGTATTLAAWRTACSCDAHSISTDPMLTNFRPGSGSPVIGAGINLTSLGITALDSDKAGVMRPGSAAWDLAAYQSNPITIGLRGAAKVNVGGKLN